MSGIYDEERAERAFSDYFGADKCVSWKSHYGERPYSTYWSSSEQEREAVKEELGIAAEQREAFAHAEKSVAIIRSLVADSKLTVQEADKLVNNVLRNVFLDEPVKTKDLREELFWKETLNDRADAHPAERENPKYEQPDKYNSDELETSKVDISDRLKDLVIPMRVEVKASDLRPETVRQYFDEWRAVVHEIVEERRDGPHRGQTEELTQHEEQRVDLSVPQSNNQSLSNGVFPSQDLDKQVSDSFADPDVEPTNIFRVDDDIEHILFGDERADSPLQLNEEPQLGDSWDRFPPTKDDRELPTDDRDNDERSR